jgi:hypothetical protein
MVELLRKLGGLDVALIQLDTAEKQTDYLCFFSMTISKKQNVARRVYILEKLSQSGTVFKATRI